MFDRSSLKDAEFESFRSVCERHGLSLESFDVELRLELITPFHATRMVCVSRAGVRQVLSPRNWIDEFEKLLSQRLSEERQIQAR
ncbi:hypothetical protein [Caballeronia sp. LZ035]|uniref:hypothetical protein n=1 Tax=Caballeronia sp. LZ035 TaxID=3038568 RepID=UPI00285B7352|nr:hypothetical protein [Caballeronia sp. LZ035]MDR5762561.1 hypothetical protein [Caballeronia sp. LZ035]